MPTHHINIVHRLHQDQIRHDFSFVVVASIHAMLVQEQVYQLYVVSLRWVRCGRFSEEVLAGGLYTL